MPLSCKSLGLWCGDCYTLIRAGGMSCTSSRGKSILQADRRADMRFVRRELGVPSLSIESGGMPDAVWMERLPALWEYLTAEEFEDGSAREVATILAFFEEGQWKVCLNDRAREASAWKSGRTLFSAMEALDADLQAGTQEWRVSRGKGRRRG